MEEIPLVVVAWKGSKDKIKTFHVTEYATNEFQARRQVLNRYMARGYVVAKIEVQHSEA